jgi:hypothetical protein
MWVPELLSRSDGVASLDFHYSGCLLRHFECNGDVTPVDVGQDLQHFRIVLTKSMIFQFRCIEAA